VLKRLAAEGLLSGKNLGVDGTTLEPELCAPAACGMRAEA